MLSGLRVRKIVSRRADLEDLMRDHPVAETELQTLVETVRQQLPPVQQQGVQRIEARDGGFAVGAQGAGSRVIVYRDHDTPPTRTGVALRPAADLGTTTAEISRAVFVAALTGPLAYRDAKRALATAGLGADADRLLTDHAYCYLPGAPSTVLEPLPRPPRRGLPGTLPPRPRPPRPRLAALVSSRRATSHTSWNTATVSGR